MRLRSCQHLEPAIEPEAPPVIEEAPYGPVIQRGLCSICGSRLQRMLRASGWSSWSPVEADA